MTDSIFAAAVERLREVQLRLKSNQYQADLEPSLTERQEVMDRYQPIFAEEHLPRLTETEFRSFLMFRNNKHWSGLQRLGSRMCQDMNKLQQGLLLLLHGNQPIADRYDQALASMNSVGRAVATAILLTVHPQQYGVWNRKSEAGLKRLNLWPRFDRGESEGNRYTRINALLLSLSKALQVDLWTLDVLWHYLGLEQGDSPFVEDEIEDEIEEAPLPAGQDTQVEQWFRLERQLHHFLWDNWNSTELLSEWIRYTEPGNESAGYEYPCGVGYIDILARHRHTRDWLVVELKRGQTSDDTVGQICRYMGWVEENLAEQGEQVHGLIICREWDKNLYYALKPTKNIKVKLYRVQFDLVPAVYPAEASR